jgi:protein-S-isoprenylcysteine O-methyltransferase Ste14
MRKLATLLYGFTAYALGMASFVYLGASLANLGVSNAIDAPRSSPLATAVAVDLLLVALFALQHSVMARPGFKATWTRIVPVPIERSTYVLASALALGLLLALWRPLGEVLWDVQDPAARGLLHGLYGFGWLAVVATTFVINHFDLFGLRQVYLRARGREYTHLPFQTPGPYSLVRHPLYVGWLLVFWATPSMTLSHLLLAGSMTAYILVAIRYEERDLVDFHGEAYARYRDRVPMLVPGLRPTPGGDGVLPATR